MSTAHDHAEGHEERMKEYMRDLTPLERAQREQKEFSGKSERELLYEKIEIIGNGDLQQGLKLIEKLSERLTHAREKHNASEWKSFTLRSALTKLQDEVSEQKYAATNESLERAMDEGRDFVMSDDLKVLIDDVVTQVKCEQIVEEWMEDKKISNRGHQWIDFSDAVLDHVERYTVPQYGDLPDDQAHLFSVEDIKANLTRYVNRIGKGARGQEEALRDCKKIAHYACLLDAKLRGE